MLFVVFSVQLRKLKQTRLESTEFAKTENDVCSLYGLLHTEYCTVYTTKDNCPLWSLDSGDLSVVDILPTICCTNGGSVQHVSSAHC